MRIAIAESIASGCEFVSPSAKATDTQKKRRHPFFQMVSSAICFGSFLILLTPHIRYADTFAFFPAQIFHVRWHNIPPTLHHGHRYSTTPEAAVQTISSSNNSKI
jgi:hypothetical protein